MALLICISQKSVVPIAQLEYILICNGSCKDRGNAAMDYFTDDRFAEAGREFFPAGWKKAEKHFSYDR